MGAARQMFCSTDDGRVDDHFDRLAVKVELIPPFCNDFFPGKNSLLCNFTGTETPHAEYDSIIYKYAAFDQDNFCKTHSGNYSLVRSSALVQSA